MVDSLLSLSYTYHVLDSMRFIAVFLVKYNPFPLNPVQLRAHTAFLELLQCRWCYSVPSLYGCFGWGGFPHESPPQFLSFVPPTKQNESAFPLGDFKTVGMSVFQAAVLTINLSFWLVAMQHIATSVRKTPDIFTAHSITQAIKCFSWVCLFIYLLSIVLWEMHVE